jgi:hypothetical protein
MIVGLALGSAKVLGEVKDFQVKTIPAGKKSKPWSVISVARNIP